MTAELLLIKLALVGKVTIERTAHGNVNYCLTDLHGEECVYFGQTEEISERNILDDLRSREKHYTKLLYS